jgi:hypothetical protein
MRGQPRTLGADRILDHLHQQFVALTHQRADVGGAIRCLLRRVIAGVGWRRKDVGNVQESGARQADLQEGRLHARQHARHEALVEVADQPAPAGALDEHLLQRTVVQQRRAALARGHVDEDFKAHPAAPRVIPPDCSSRAVSYSGSPITPE